MGNEKKEEMEKGRGGGGGGGRRDGWKLMGPFVAS